MYVGGISKQAVMNKMYVLEITQSEVYIDKKIGLYNELRGLSGINDCKQGTAKGILYRRRDPYGILNRTVAIKPAKDARKKRDRLN